MLTELVDIAKTITTKNNDSVEVSLYIYIYHFYKYLFRFIYISLSILITNIVIDFDVKNQTAS